MAAATSSTSGSQQPNRPLRRPRSMIITIDTDSIISNQPGPGRTLDRFIGALADRLPFGHNVAPPTDFDYEVEWSGSHDTLLTLESSSTASNLPGPGRTVGKLIAKVGDRTSDYINILADKMRMGPNAVVSRLMEEQNLHVSGKDRKKVLKIYKKLLSFLSVREAGSQALVINYISLLIAHNIEHRTALLDLRADETITNLLYTHSPYYRRNQRDLLLASSRRALFCLSDAKVIATFKEVHAMEYSEVPDDHELFGDHLRSYLQSLVNATRQQDSVVLATTYLAKLPVVFTFFCLEYLIFLGILDILPALLKQSQDKLERRSYAILLHGIVDALAITTRHWWTELLSSDTRSIVLQSFFNLLNCLDPSEWSGFGLDKCLGILTRPVDHPVGRFPCLWRRDIVGLGAVGTLTNLRQRARRAQVAQYVTIDAILRYLQPDMLESVIDGFEHACIGTPGIDRVPSEAELYPLVRRLLIIWNAKDRYPGPTVKMVAQNIALRNKYCRLAFIRLMNTCADVHDKEVIAFKGELESWKPRVDSYTNRVASMLSIGTQASSSRPHNLYIGRSVCNDSCAFGGPHLYFGTLQGSMGSMSLFHDGTHHTIFQSLYYYDWNSVMWLDHYDETPVQFTDHAPVLAGQDSSGVRHYVAVAFHEEDLRSVLAEGVTRSLYPSESWYPCAVTEGASHAVYVPEPNGGFGWQSVENLFGKPRATDFLQSCDRTPRTTTRFRVLVLADDTESVILTSVDYWGRKITDSTGPVGWSG